MTDNDTFNPAEDKAKLLDLRQRILKGDPVSDEEVADAVMKARANRVTAAMAGKKTARPRKAKDLPVAGPDLLTKEIKP